MCAASRSSSGSTLLSNRCSKTVQTYVDLHWLALFENECFGPVNVRSGLTQNMLSLVWDLTRTVCDGVAWKVRSFDALHSGHPRQTLRLRLPRSMNGHRPPPVPGTRVCSVAARTGSPPGWHKPDLRLVTTWRRSCQERARESEKTHRPRRPRVRWPRSPSQYLVGAL